MAKVVMAIRSPAGGRSVAVPGFLQANTDSNWKRTRTPLLVAIVALPFPPLPPLPSSLFLFLPLLIYSLMDVVNWPFLEMSKFAIRDSIVSHRKAACRVEERVPRFVMGHCLGVTLPWKGRRSRLAVFLPRFRQCAPRQPSCVMFIAILGFSRAMFSIFICWQSGHFHLVLVYLVAKGFFGLYQLFPLNVLFDYFTFLSGLWHVMKFHIMIKLSLNIACFY